MKRALTLLFVVCITGFASAATSYYCEVLNTYTHTAYFSNIFKDGDYEENKLQNSFATYVQETYQGRYYTAVCFPAKDHDSARGDKDRSVNQDMSSQFKIVETRWTYGQQ